MSPTVTRFDEFGNRTVTEVEAPPPPAGPGDDTARSDLAAEMVSLADALAAATTLSQVRAAGTAAGGRLRPRR